MEHGSEQSRQMSSPTQRAAEFAPLALRKSADAGRWAGSPTIAPVKPATGISIGPELNSLTETTMNTASIQPRVHIGHIIRNAVVFNFKNWRGGSVQTDSLLETVARLFAALRERKIEYLLVGGIALLHYIEGRNTEDIDLLMALPALKKLPEIEITSQDDNFARGKFNELQIDILLTRNPLFEKVRKHYATTQRFVEQDLPCATVEGLLLLKLYALPALYRQGNFARVGIHETDIATLLHDYPSPLEPLFDELALHLNETDLAAVKEVVADIQQRIKRFGKGLDASE